MTGNFFVTQHTQTTCTQDIRTNPYIGAARKITSNNVHIVEKKADALPNILYAHSELVIKSYKIVFSTPDSSIHAATACPVYCNYRNVKCSF